MSRHVFISTKILFICASSTVCNQCCRVLHLCMELKFHVCHTSSSIALMLSYKFMDSLNCCDLALDFLFHVCLMYST